MRKAVLLGVLAAVMLVGVVGVAVADTATYSGAASASNAADLVEVKASVNPKITLSINTPDAAQEVLFGAVDPETEYTRNVGLEVKSNKSWTMAVVKGGHDAELGLTTGYEAGTAQAKGTWTDNDLYTINVPFDTAPGDYVATVQYTVTQD